MLSKEVYLQILDLEEKVFTNKSVTLERVNQLVDKYAACVEYFDTIADPIKIYFLEKIQITLASTKFLNILVRNRTSQIEQTILTRQDTNKSTQRMNDTKTGQRMHNSQMERKGDGQQNSQQNKEEIAQQTFSELIESKERTLKYNAKLPYAQDAIDETVYEQIETQATERGDENNQIIILDTLEESCCDNQSQLLKNEIDSYRAYQRPYFYQKNNQCADDFSDFASICNSIVQVDSKTQSIINHLNQDILSPKFQEEVYDENKKKIERAKRVDLFMKVHGNKDTHPDHPDVKINNLIQNYEQQLKQNDAIVQSDIQNQIEQVQEKLIRKKTKNQIQELNKTLIDNQLSPRSVSEYPQIEINDIKKS